MSSFSLCAIYSAKRTFVNDVDHLKLTEWMQPLIVYVCVIIVSRLLVLENDVSFRLGSGLTLGELISPYDKDNTGVIASFPAGSFRITVSGVWIICGMRKVICGTKSAEWKWLVDGHDHVISRIPQITIPTFGAWRGDNLRNLWCGIAVANNGKRRKRCKT